MIKLTLLSTLLLFYLCTAVIAQTNTGTITGEVYDATKAVVPGAKVRVTNLATNIAQETTATGAGNFSLQSLQPGAYRVEVTAQGFKSATIRSVEVLRLVCAETRDEMEVLIAGGGIGGLVTALCLERAGIEAHVFESVAEMRPLGAGVNLLPHSARVLMSLGLGPKLAETAIETSELLYFNKFGQRLWREPRGVAAGYCWPQYSIHRGRLQMMLFDEAVARLGAERVRTGCHLASFAEWGDAVEATFVDRATGAAVGVEAGDALIGADGIYSRVRRHFYPDELEPKFSGRLLWRGVTESQRRIACGSRAPSSLGLANAISIR